MSIKAAQSFQPGAFFQSIESFHEFFFFLRGGGEGEEGREGKEEGEKKKKKERMTYCQFVQ